MADPIVDQICQFLGGAYNADFHAYRTSTVAGVAQVRRGFDRLTDYADFFVGMPVGTLTGCQIVVWVTNGTERRKTMPAVAGRKHNRYQVELCCYFWSSAPYVEDCQDQVHAVKSAIIAKLRTDPTCGSGGIEAGAFHIGIPDDGGGGGDIDWTVGDPDTSQPGATKQYLRIAFEAHELPTG